MNDAALGILCIECACGRRAWLRHAEVHFRQHAELRRHLRCESCGKRGRASIARPDALTSLEPIFPSHLGFHVEEWDPIRDRPVQLRAVANNVSVALAAYEAVRIDQPDRYILLRQGARVVTHSFVEREDVDMCGRFSQHYTWREIHAFSQPLILGGPPLNLEPRYNISPTQEVGVLVPAGGDELT